MADPVSGIVRRLRQLASVPEDRQQNDAELLRRFLSSRDEVAFADLVARHGPLVLSVSRSLLGRHHDAEDVFQATFLVLARKAESIRKQASLASWLHGVARRLALKARSRTLRRERREQHTVPDPVQPSAMEDMTWRELREVLHDEVARLPDKYRLPVLLCYWEGHTQDEAARQLGWSPHTLKDRLVDARKRLRQRLIRRGLLPAVPLFAAWLAANGLAEAAPPSLIDAATRAALLFANGQSLDTVSPRITELAQGALTAMLMTKVKMVAVLVLLLTLVAASVTLAAWQPGTATPSHARQPQPPAPPRPDVDAGDPLPTSTLYRLGTTRLRQGKQLSGLSFSADAKLLATCSTDSFINLWDPATGKLLRRSQDDQHDLVQNVALSPDGKLLAAGYQRGRLVLTDAETGKELRRLEGLKEHVTGILFSQDGKTLFAGEIRHPAIRCWEVATGQEVRTFAGHKDGTKFLSLSADGALLASCGYDYEMAVWDVATGKEVRRWHDAKGESIYAVALSPDGKLLAGGGFLKRVTIWDVASGKELQVLEGHQDWVNAVAFTPDGRTLFSGGRDAVVFGWDPNTGKQIQQIREARNSIRRLAVTADGKTLAMSTGSAVLLCDAATGKLLRPADGHLGEVYRLAHSPDGKLLASCGQDGSVILWDPVTGKELRRLTGHTNSDVYAIAFSPDGSLIASGANDAKVCIWRTSGELLATYTGHKSCVGFLHFSPDGKRLVSVDWFDAGLIVWNLFDGEGKVRAKGDQVQGFKLHDNRVSTVAFSPDGKTLAAADEEKRQFLGGIDTSPSIIRLWDVSTGQELRKLDGHRGCQIRGMAFSPDGKLLASGGTGFLDKDVRVWDVATGKELQRLPGRAEQVAFSPDGRTLATVPDWTSPDIRLWELATTSERARLNGHRDAVMHIEFSGDGKTLASASRDTTVLVWNLSGSPQKGAIAQKEFEALWQDLLGGDAAKSYRALHRLASVPEQTVPYLKERSARVDPKRLEGLLADLDSDKFETRETAGRELDKVLEQAETALRKASEEHPSTEVRRRAERLLEALPVRAPRLAEVLELTGTLEARRLMEKWAEGPPEAKLTQEAQATVKRWTQR